MNTAAADPQAVVDLQTSFDAFTQISRDLESAYERLRLQAGRIDVALAESNRRLAEKVDELDLLSGHLQSVLQSLREAVVVTDREDRITLVNPAFEKLAGAPLQALRGRRKQELKDVRGEALCAGPQPAGGVRLYQGPDGARLLLRSSIAPIESQGLGRRGEVETLVDETETERLRDELRRRETLSALGAMAAGIAHELRNPLSAIEGFSQLLIRALPPDREECAGHARRVVLGVRKANSIISNLLCFAQPQRFKPRSVPLFPLLETLRHSYLGSAPVVAVHRPDPPSLRVLGDLALLERLLVNLLENARAAAGPNGHVRLTAEAWGPIARLCVEDDGPGIPPELRESLFLPFVSAREGGVGLGLSIVHRIVDLHRGRIAVEERPGGGGTIFKVELPTAAGRRSVGRRVSTSLGPAAEESA